MIPDLPCTEPSYREAGEGMLPIQMRHAALALFLNPTQDGGDGPTASPGFHPLPATIGAVAQRPAESPPFISTWLENASSHSFYPNWISSFCLAYANAGQLFIISIALKLGRRKGTEKL